MPTSATLTGPQTFSGPHTVTLTGYASDILQYDWYAYSASSGGTSTHLVTHPSSGVSDDVDQYQVDGRCANKWIGCTATLDGETAASNRIGPLSAGGNRAKFRVLRDSRAKGANLTSYERARAAEAAQRQQIA